jgi:hypothetical protein
LASEKTPLRLSKLGQGAASYRSAGIIRQTERWRRRERQKNEVSEEKERPERIIGEGQEAGTRTFNEGGKMDEDAL